jgi:hypothetical protein
MPLSHRIEAITTLPGKSVLETSAAQPGSANPLWFNAVTNERGWPVGDCPLSSNSVGEVIVIMIKFHATPGTEKGIKSQVRGSEHFGPDCHVGAHRVVSILFWPIEARHQHMWR